MRDRKISEKTDAFAGCMILLTIMFMLVAIGEILEDASSMTEVSEYAAVQLRNCGGDHEH